MDYENENIEDLADLLGVDLGFNKEENLEINYDENESEREEIEEQKTKLKVSEQGISKILLVSLTFGITILAAGLGFALSTGQLRKSKPLNYVENVQETEELSTDDILKQKAAEISALKTKLAISEQEKAQFSDIDELLKEEKTSLKITSTDSKSSVQPTSIEQPQQLRSKVSPMNSTSYVPQKPKHRPKATPKIEVANLSYVNPKPISKLPLPPPLIEREERNFPTLTANNSRVEKRNTDQDWIALAQIGAYNFNSESSQEQVEDKTENLVSEENQSMVFPKDSQSNLLNDGRQQRLRDNINSNESEIALENLAQTRKEISQPQYGIIQLKPRKFTNSIELVPREISQKSFSNEQFQSKETEKLLVDDFQEKSNSKRNLVTIEKNSDLITNNLREEELRIIEDYNNSINKFPQQEVNQNRNKTGSFILSGTRVRSRLLTPVYYSDSLLLDPENPENKIRFKFVVEIEEPLKDNLGQEIIETGSQIIFEVVEVLPNGVPNFKSVILIKNNQEYPLPPNVFSIRGEEGDILIAKEKKLNKSEIFRRDVLGMILNTATSIGEELTRPTSKTSSTNRTDGDTSIIQVEEDPRDVLGAVFKGAEGLNRAVAARNEDRITELLERQKLWVLDLNKNQEMQLFVEQPFSL